MAKCSAVDGKKMRELLRITVNLNGTVFQFSSTYCIGW
jgi:hypothetical protein